jgi:hypothetical protein
MGSYRILLMVKSPFLMGKSSVNLRLARVTSKMRCRSDQVSDMALPTTDKGMAIKSTWLMQMTTITRLLEIPHPKNIHIYIYTYIHPSIHACMHANIVPYHTIPYHTYIPYIPYTHYIHYTHSINHTYYMHYIHITYITYVTYTAFITNFTYITHITCIT